MSALPRGLRGGVIEISLTQDDLRAYVGPPARGGKASEQSQRARYVHAIQLEAIHATLPLQTVKFLRFRENLASNSEVIS